MQTGQTYRDTLRQELVNRCDRNPRYSLRSFARDLRLSPPRLSDILNSKKGISRVTAQSISNSIGLSENEKEFFCTSAEALHSRSKAARQAALARLKAMGRSKQDSTTLTLDAFRAVSDWYHFAILQLLKLPKAKSDPTWIAHCLGLRAIQVKEALERMVRLEMVARRQGKYVPTTDWVFTTDGVPSDALKKFHEQILQKATAAIYSQSVSERNILAVMMPMASEDLESARRRIAGFLNQLSDELSSSDECDSVYCFSTQLFNLTPALKGGS